MSAPFSVDIAQNTCGDRRNERLSLIWSIIFALAGAFFTWETGKQLYTATMKGYILTGRSMNRRVDRKTDGRLFRNNLIANLILFPLFAGGFVMFSLTVLEGLER